MKKKLIALTLSLVMLAALLVPCVTAGEQSFTDVSEKDWYVSYTDKAAEEGLIEGTGAGEFEPDADMTRAMFATVLYRAAQNAGKGFTGAWMFLLPYEDIAEIPDWAYEPIAWCTMKGVLNGYPNGCVGPNDPLTREQMAAMLYRFANAMGQDTSIAENTNILSYEDAFDITSYACFPFQYCCGAGIIEGNDKGYLMPQAVASRAEAITMIVRMLETFVETPAAPEEPEPTRPPVHIDTDIVEEPETKPTLREIVVENMDALSQVIWTPAKEFSFKTDFKVGTTYQGLPYFNEVDGSLEEFLGNLEDGVYVGPTEELTGIGVDCTSSALSCLARVCPSLTATWTRALLPKYNEGVDSIETVGDYVVPDLVSNDSRTTYIWNANDVQTMYEALAQVKPGDLLITYDTSGHCRMVVEEPVVERLEDGTISGFSYLTTTEITGVYNKNEAGYMSNWKVHHRYYFMELKSTNYVPLTLSELDLEESAPLELAVTEENTAETLMANKGLTGSLTSNYRINVVEATITNASGVEVRSAVKYPQNTTKNDIGKFIMISKEFDLAKLNDELDMNALTTGEYTLKLTAKANEQVVTVLEIPFTYEAEMNDMRARAIAYYKEMASVEWTPSVTMDFSGSKAGLKYEAGKTYVGLPYTNEMDSSLEEFLSYVEDGKYVGPTAFTECTGVDATSAILAAWGRECYSVNYTWSKPMLPSYVNGPVAVGGYDPLDRAVSTAAAPTTLQIVAENGASAIYEAYANCLPGDALLYRYESVGGTVMVSEKANVVYKANGDINPAESTITVLSMSTALNELEDGKLTNWTEREWTFENLRENAYVPVAPAELIRGTNIDANVQISKENTDETVPAAGLLGEISSEYRIYRVKAEILDAEEKVVASAEAYPVNTLRGGADSYYVASRSYNLETLNSALKIDALENGEYTLKLTALTGGEDVEALNIDFEIAREGGVAKFAAWTVFQTSGFSMAEQQFMIPEGSTAAEKVKIKVTVPAKSAALPFQIKEGETVVGEGTIPASTEGGIVTPEITWTEGYTVAKETEKTLNFVTAYDAAGFYIKTNYADSTGSHGWYVSWESQFANPGDTVTVYAERRGDTVTNKMNLWVERTATNVRRFVEIEDTFVKGTTYKVSFKMSFENTGSNDYYCNTKKLLVTIRQNSRPTTTLPDPLEVVYFGAVS